MIIMYEFAGGKYNGALFSRKEIETIGNGSFTMNLSKEREMGGIVHRKELDDQPLVDGYLSPMWDGLRYRMPDGSLEYDFRLSEEEKEGKEVIAILRYETQDVYDMLSN